MLVETTWLNVARKMAVRRRGRQNPMLFAMEQYKSQQIVPKKIQTLKIVFYIMIILLPLVVVRRFCYKLFPL